MTTLVYYSGTKNPDGSCTLMQMEAPDAAAITDMVLKCDGTTSQGSTWTYAPVAGQSFLSVQFIQEGSVYSSGGGIVTDEPMYCEQS